MAEHPAQGADAIGSGRLLADRDYVGWFVGETLSTFGTSVSSLAYPLLMLAATGDAAKAGLVAGAGSMGLLLTLLIGGVLSDRWSRRRLLAAGPLVQAAALGSIAAAVVTGHVVVLHIAAAALVDGAVVGLTSGAGRAAIRRIVPAELMPRAVSAWHGRDSALKLVGPPLAGVFFGIARALPFVIDAISYVAATVGALVIRRPLGPDPDERGDGSIWASLTEGLRYLRTSAYLRFVTVWAALLNMFGGAFTLLAILLVRRNGGSAQVAGIVTGIGAVGGIVGALTAGRVVARWPGRGLVLALSWALPAVFAGMAVMPTPWGIGVVMAIVGLVAVPLNVALESYEISAIPDHLVGRVTNAIDFSAMSLRWSGPVIAGVLAHSFGSPAAALVWAAGLAIVAIYAGVAEGPRELDRFAAQSAAQSAAESAAQSAAADASRGLDGSGNTVAPGTAVAGEHELRVDPGEPL